MRLHVLDPGASPFDAGSCLIVPVYQDVDLGYGSSINEADAAALKQVAEQSRFEGKAEHTCYLATPESAYSGVLALGLGEHEAFNAEALRRAAGKACSILAKQRHKHAVFDGSCGEALPVEAFVEGIMLGQYDFQTYKKAPDTPRAVVEEITILAPGAEGLEEVREGCLRTVLACENANWARDLANTPPCDMTPTALAARAQTMADETGCACTILDEAKMEELGMGAILGVSKGSSEPARLIILHYTHPDADRTVAMVGKGVTFDTGGISIKAGPGMEEMKYDMCGAAAVLGAMKTICQNKPKVNVVGVVPSSENKTGSAAYVPGDIVRCYNGKTVEVHNTDAEGRMLLADALAYTEKNYAPDAIVDIATLTGACVAALGTFAAGLFSTNEELVAELQLAGGATGERVWRMPLWEDYRKLVNGTHADLCNIGPRGEAGASVAAGFLSHFVEKTAWAHVDIAGTAWSPRNISYLNSKHATGFGVRLLSQWVLEMET